MKHIVIWGTGKSVLKLQKELDFDVCDIVAYVETNTTKTEFSGKPVLPYKEMKSLDFDYMFVASVYYREIEQLIKENFKIEKEKIVIWPLIYKEIRERDDSFLLLFKKNFLVYYKGKEYMPIQSCRVDDLTFIHSSQDDCILSNMYFTNTVWEKKNIDQFITLAQTYYGISLDEQGLFLDIGANIGTTSIYALSRYCKNMKCIAFEPVKKVCNILKSNVILNNMEERFIVENIGISEKNESKVIWLSNENLGGNGVRHYDNEHFKEEQLASFMSLNSYIQSSKLDAKDIKLIWVDIEGCEAEMIFGAQKVLEENAIPLFTEFNCGCYKQDGTYEKLCSILSSIYSQFICMEDYSEGITPRKISELDDLVHEKRGKQVDLFFIK